MIIIILALALIVGFMIADAILDWAFIAVYALLVTAILNNIIHLFKYYRKYHKMFMDDIGKVFLFLVIGAVVIVLQITLL